MTMPSYSRHVVIRTGRSDWASRIEDEESSVLGDVQEGKPRANLAKSLKELVGPGGRYYDPSRNFLITNSSLEPPTKAPHHTAIHVFPQNIYIPKLVNTPEDHELFVRQYLLGEGERRHLDARELIVQKNVENMRGEAQASKDDAPETGSDDRMSETDDRHQGRLKPSSAVRSQHIRFFKSDSPTILICGHNSRDSRCGILGPLLKKEFDSYISDQVYKTAAERMPNGQIRFHMTRNKSFVVDTALRGTKTALISHVGGHVWAGNVIIYLPHTYCLKSGERSPLAGKGIWYGRVEPRHVEGIVEQTIRQGCVIEELLRGVHNQPHQKLQNPIRRVSKARQFT
ncbi:MAG: hypothetical protein Q9163_002580 [Psora crenata]